MAKETAIFAAGCFWHVQEEFDKLEGVLETEVGYTGGNTENPSYEDVCSGKTGHAEAIKIVFDSEKISYEKLLEKFWEIHDPTTLNRQGADVGSNYRSAIFYTKDSQKKSAEKSKKAEEKKLGNPITTEIAKASEFYSAEEYHQDYYKKHKGAKVCGGIIKKIFKS